MFPTEARRNCGRFAAVDEREGRDAQGDDKESATARSERWSKAYGERSGEQSKQVGLVDVLLRLKSNSCPEREFPAYSSDTVAEHL
jgi:hypothetical protein